VAIEAINEISVYLSILLYNSYVFVELPEEVYLPRIQALCTSAYSSRYPINNKILDKAGLGKEGL
jgi:hypothetical protein